MNVEVLGILPIIRLKQQPPPGQLFDALVEGGVGALEITIATPKAFDSIESWSNRSSSIRIGAGSVLSRKDVANCASAGADFLVTPNICNEVLEEALKHNLDVYCGASTPTEIVRAFNHPAVKAVKVFPSKMLGGVEYLRAVLDPLPHIPLVPTGGIGRNNFEDYLKLNLFGLGIGSSLVNDQRINANDFEGIRVDTQHMVSSWGSVNGQ